MQCWVGCRGAEQAVVWLQGCCGVFSPAIVPAACRNKLHEGVFLQVGFGGPVKDGISFGIYSCLW